MPLLLFSPERRILAGKGIHPKFHDKKMHASIYNLLEKYKIKGKEGLDTFIYARKRKKQA